MAEQAPASPVTGHVLWSFSLDDRRLNCRDVRVDVPEHMVDQPHLFQSDTDLDGTANGCRNGRDHDGLHVEDVPEPVSEYRDHIGGYRCVRRSTISREKPTNGRRRRLYEGNDSSSLDRRDD